MSIQRLRGAWRAFSTRRVPREEMIGVGREGPPRAGDLVLARVDRIGQATRLHLHDGRRRTLFVGDEIVVAYGARYAPRHFEALVPGDLSPCHLAACGGVAGRVVTRHDRIRPPTEITPLGRVTDHAGRVLNVGDFALPSRSASASAHPPTLVFAGTSMSSGKTTCAANLTRGVGLTGLRVGYAKVTGTAAAGDPTLLLDAGADPVLDFTDAGHVSTYLLSAGEVERILARLHDRACAAGVDVVLLELADGLLQRETHALLASQVLRRRADAFVLAAADAMGAAAGVDRLRAAGHRVLAVSGALTAAPLQAREVEEQVGVYVPHSKELLDPATARKLVRAARVDDV